jgi:predicted dehydrogenase
LAADFWIRLTTDAGTQIRRCPPPRYAWADPAYDVNHASMVPIHQDFLRALRTGDPPENTGEDNLKTMRLVYAAYESAERNEVIVLDQ